MKTWKAVKTLLVMAGLIFEAQGQTSELFIAKVTISKTEGQTEAAPKIPEGISFSPKKFSINNANNSITKMEARENNTVTDSNQVDEDISELKAIPINRTLIKSAPSLDSSSAKPSIDNKNNQWYQLQGNIKRDYVYLMLENAGKDQVTGYLFDSKGNNKNVYGEWYRGQLQLYGTTGNNKKDVPEKNKRLNIIFDNH